jgi:hypothetical protein
MESIIVMTPPRETVYGSEVLEGLSNGVLSTTLSSYGKQLARDAERSGIQGFTAYVSIPCTSRKTNTGSIALQRSRRRP